MARKRLPSRLNLLTVRSVLTAGEGEHSDGGGLLLRVRGNSATWVLRYTSLTGPQRREMGFGPIERSNAAIAGKSLSNARELAAAARALLQRDIDPIDERHELRAVKKRSDAEKQKESKRERLTLARAARDYHARVVEPKRTDKHAAQWIKSLENHVPAGVWHKPIAAIEAPEVLDFMIDLQTKVPETASRVRQRLEAIFEDAMFRDQCAANPAVSIRRKLREMGARRPRGRFASLDYSKAPALIEALRKINSVSARCLEFAVLTAARTGEAIGAEWREFDLDAATWTVPGDRMKAGEKHIVFLTPRAVEIVRAHAGLDARFVFPSPQLNGEPLSNMALLMQLRRMKIADETTVHGLCRATFSTWANETGAARPDVIEACLAHHDSNPIRAAYNRAEVRQNGGRCCWRGATFCVAKRRQVPTTSYCSKRLS